MPDDLDLEWPRVRVHHGRSRGGSAWRERRRRAITSRSITTNTFRSPPSRSLAVDGEYRIRITEEFSEVAYIDQLKLIAVDHPRSYRDLHQRKIQIPSFPEFRLYGVRKPIRPRAAKTSERSQCARSRDRQRRTLSRRLPPQHSPALPDLHHLDLDFGSAPPKAFSSLTAGSIGLTDHISGRRAGGQRRI